MQILILLQFKETQITQFKEMQIIQCQTILLCLMEI